ncbi:GntR family transcriptional regulator [Clostridium formicaceticum]|jgi:DNA-binding transcriptional regulator YhcF (GntR family)|uniref:GntR family transcriptional regulator n=1 Tax=Clostridium formicaceticum TaxID=1497 RepID=A0AAC9RGD7_9CLOT|nr:GntR family transcriptional regulator [Clostridium formicaceticum]AOY75965.1 GntR family transcriptional regulator [Clostridium formicaceticum]ARE86314.1 HTH-type transcriptional repressor YtrA [Clostridium formicaceticum]
MLLKIDFESEIPIYQQIKNQVIKGIATGELSPGEDLPSVRQLAADIGINFHTVNKGYTLLKQEGWVVIHRKSGVMVNPEFKTELTEEYMETLEENLEIIAAEAYLRGLSSKDFQKIINNKFSNFIGKRGK